MRRAIDRARGRLTYANVVATLAAFAVLAGGSALAADQLAKNSVGKKQLKANAVTTAKIKKNAVTKAKIRNAAVDGSKVKAGNLGAADFQLADAPYTRIVAELRTSVNAPVSAVPTEPTFVPLPGFSYTQEAGRTDSYVGAVDVTFDPGCTDGRVGAYVLIDAPPIEKFELTTILLAAAAGTVEEEGPGKGTKRIHLGPFPGARGTEFAPGTAQNHTFTLLLGGKCESGSGITAKSVALDVIGTK